MHSIRTICIGLALTLLVGSAAAQDDRFMTEMEELQSSYERAWVAGDTDAVAALFTDDAVFWPLSGGSVEGREQIRAALEEDVQPETADITSTRVERIGDIGFGVGTFSITLPEAEAANVGAATLEGEYVVVTEETDEGLRISRLVSFQPRRAPERPQ